MLKFEKIGKPIVYSTLNILVYGNTDKKPQQNVIKNNNLKMMMIKTKFSKNMFYCRSNIKILEVRICLDKSFVAVNCSDSNKGMKLLYPKPVSASRSFPSNTRTGACIICSDPSQIQNPWPDLVGRSKYSSLEFSYLWLLLLFCSWYLLF